ncbi:XRE family transcriptional regulator [uncultured Gemella sp.]|uniref:XRE family transcriptional regulator n=1 Tax=uncultured Gemella sp. TaxID=254352 RepID=UPI0028D0F3A5|nr:XRE family transcriptional regulator [uncultured Gemella sp.]
MDDKNIHGKIFKKIREERRIKLKDAAGNAISARTLIRFEADETSVSLEVFEQLLRNIGICYQDYFSEYLPLIEVDQSGFLKEANALENAGNYSAVKTLAIKILEGDNISMTTRLYIEQYLGLFQEKMIPKIITENRKIVLDYLQNLEKHTKNELLTLALMLRVLGEDQISIEFIRRIIDENLKPVGVGDMFSVDKGERALLTLHSAIALLSRRGYVEEAEGKCLKAIELLKSNYYKLTHFNFHANAFFFILAQMQLKLNKPEGVELANKCIRIIDAQIELYNMQSDIHIRDSLVRSFYERNKTGIDFEF